MWAEGPARYVEAGGEGRAVRIALDLRGLEITSMDGTPVDGWSFGALILLPCPRDRLVITAGGEPARVEIDEPQALEDFRAALKALPTAGQPAIPTNYLGAIAAGLLILVAVVSLLIWALSETVDLLAPLVPEEIVAELDNGALPQVLAEIGSSPDAACTAPAGVAALDRLVDRLADAAGGRELDLKVGVWRAPVANALALPGGTIVITDSLIARAGTVDALAGVIAHEIGHVSARDGLRAMIHQAGLWITLTAITGDPGGLATIATGSVLGARYSREAERAADRFAVDAVAAAGGDPKALGPFLVDLVGDGEPQGPGALLASHPMSEERATAIATRAADRVIRPGPLASPDDLAAIRAICAP